MLRVADLGSSTVGCGQGSHLSHDRTGPVQRGLLTGELEICNRSFEMNPGLSLCPERRRTDRSGRVAANRCVVDPLRHVSILRIPRGTLVQEKRSDVAVFGVFLTRVHLWDEIALGVDLRGVPGSIPNGIREVRRFSRDLVQLEPARRPIEQPCGITARPRGRPVALTFRKISRHVVAAVVPLLIGRVTEIQKRSIEFVRTYGRDRASKRRQERGDVARRTSRRCRWATSYAQGHAGRPVCARDR